MMPTIKPYRLISPDEMRQLKQTFEKKVLHWQTKAACMPLKMDLQVVKKQPKLEHVLLLSNDTMPLAILEEESLNHFQYSLFGDEAPCFANATLSLIKAFVLDILDIEPIEMTKTVITNNAWFYPGSPVLNLSLTTDKGHSHFYLHPQCILRFLPKSKPRTTAIAPLDKALEPQEFTMEVNLKPFNLPLNQLLALQLGDVIKTDHRLTEPLSLDYQQQALSPVELGQSLSFKSVKIMRTP